MQKINNICVYCSSSNTVDAIYKKAAVELGKQLAQKAIALVYGGANLGLMMQLAKSVKENNGKVIGILPHALKERGYHAIDQLIMVSDLRERKAMMQEHAQAFIALPGGFGTLDELVEIITLKQLGLHTKPIVILNVNNFYQKQIEQFNIMFEKNFAHSKDRELFFITQNTMEAIEHILNG